MLKLFTGCVASTVLTLAANAQSDLKISLDLRNFRVLFYGTYAPKSVEAAKTGLQAESQARSNGIFTMQRYMNSNCNKSQGLNASGTWKQGLSSLGSEVYPNGVLRIHLRSRMERILQTGGATAFGPEDKTHVFCVGNRVSLPEKSCGILNISLNGKKYRFLPQKVDKGSAKTIALYPRGDTLFPLRKHKEDINELLGSFTPSAGTVYLLPVSPTC